MLELIKDIEETLENGNIRCSLGMALTLPDICGIVEFPEYKEEVSKRYIGWCEKYLFNQGFLPSRIIDLDNPDNNGEKSRIIEPDMCFKLRCAYLHSGNLELNQREKDSFPKFHLRLTSSIDNGIYLAKITSSANGEVTDVHIDARNLIKVLCNAAKEYYENSDKKSEFENHHVEILDVEYELNIIHNAEREFLEFQKNKNNIKSYDELSDKAKTIHKLIVDGEKEALAKKINDPFNFYAIMELYEGEFIKLKKE